MGLESAHSLFFPPALPTSSPFSGHAAQNGYATCQLPESASSVTALHWVEGQKEGRSRKRRKPSSPVSAGKNDAGLGHTCQVLTLQDRLCLLLHAWMLISLPTEVFIMNLLFLQEQYL